MGSCDQAGAGPGLGRQQGRAREICVAKERGWEAGLQFQIEGQGWLSLT